jgi:hypothetical protein
MDDCTLSGELDDCTIARALGAAFTDDATVLARAKHAVANIEAGMAWAQGTGVLHELGVLVKGLTAFLTAANEAGRQLPERQHRERRAVAEAEADRERRDRLKAELAAWKTQRK